jgi:hypothetical protein
MTCDDYALLIGELIDDAAEPGAARAAQAPAAQAHLQTCPACRALADDLTRLRGAARTLEAPALPAHLWPRIAAALEREYRPDRERGPRLAVVGEASPAARLRGPDVNPRPAVWAWLPAAAALLLVAGGLSWVSTRLAPDARPAMAAAESADGLPDADTDAAEDLQIAEAAFTDAIAGLEAAARAEAPALDPQATDEWLEGVAALDAAIDESREAIRIEPASVLAQERLLDALRTKMVLLHDTVALMDDMRAGGPDGLGPDANPERELRQ